MGEEGEGSGVKGGGKWGERGREVGIRYPPPCPPPFCTKHNVPNFLAFQSFWMFFKINV